MIAFEIPIHHSINDTKLPQHIFNAYAVRFYSLNKNLSSIGESQSWFDLFLWGHEEKKPADALFQRSWPEVAPPHPGVAAGTAAPINAQRPVF
jgi:hypothetical protein